MTFSSCTVWPHIQKQGWLRPQRKIFVTLLWHGSWTNYTWKRKRFIGKLKNKKQENTAAFNFSVKHPSDYCVFWHERVGLCVKLLNGEKTILLAETFRFALIWCKFPESAKCNRPDNIPLITPFLSQPHWSARSFGSLFLKCCERTGMCECCSKLFSRWIIVQVDCDIIPHHLTTGIIC